MPMSTEEDEIARLRKQVGRWSQMIQNGSGSDTDLALREMLTEADKAPGKTIWKYDPRPYAEQMQGTP